MMTLGFIPEGCSYVRIACSKSATMRLILETVQRGSRYWTSGIVALEKKAEGMANKFAELYGTDMPQHTRTRRKAKGLANATLIMYPQDDQHITHLLWWLLVTPGEGLVNIREQLKDAHNKRQRLQWEDQYVLLHKQHSQNTGGGRHWTWECTQARYDSLLTGMLALSRGSGNTRSERTDDLALLIQQVWKMPGFHGIRMQQMALMRAGRETWNRTHQAPYGGWPQAAPAYLDKRLPVYHRPTVLRLDQLGRLVVAK